MCVRKELSFANKDISVVVATLHAKCLLSAQDHLGDPMLLIEPKN